MRHGSINAALMTSVVMQPMVACGSMIDNERCKFWTSHARKKTKYHRSDLGGEESYSQWRMQTNHAIALQQRFVHGCLAHMRLSDYSLYWNCGAAEQSE